MLVLCASPAPELTSIQGQFLPWHRYYMYLHEYLLRTECNYTGAQPYVHKSLHTFIVLRILNSNLTVNKDTGKNNKTSVQVDKLPHQSGITSQALVATGPEQTYA